MTKKEAVNQISDKPKFVDFEKHLTEKDIEIYDWYFSADVGMCMNFSTN